MLSLTAETSNGSGTNGAYWRINSTTGVKINFGTGIKAEARWLQKLNKMFPGLFPKFKGYKFVDYEGQYTLGIMMEHINGNALMISQMTYSQKRKVERIIQKMKLKRLVFDDISGNIIIDINENIRLVDADPHYFHFIKVDL